MKIILPLITCLLAISSPYLSADFGDLFSNFIDPCIAYGKRSTQIKEKIISSLNTGHKIWKEEGEAFPHKTGMDFVFTPENQYPSGWKDPFNYILQEKFSYCEYDSKKDDKRIYSVDDYVNLVVIARDEERNSYTQSIISNTNTELAFELYIKPKSQKYVSTSVDEDGFRITQEKEKTHPENAGLHVIGKAMYLGGSKYVVYKYESKNKKLSPDEKAYWFQMLDYARINF